MTTGAWPSGQFPVVGASILDASPLAPLLPEGRARGIALDFDEVYEAEVAFVWRCVRRAGVPLSSVEDAVQDVFLVIHRHLNEYDGRSPLKSWLYGISQRVAADHRRRFRRKESKLTPMDAGEDGEERFTSSFPPPCAQAEQAEAVRLLDRLLEGLHPDKREVLVLAELEEMSVPEIASCLGANVNTVYSRLRAAKRELEEAHARHLAQSGEAAP